MSARKTQPQCRIGTSGYQYKHWRGDFYPAKMPTKEWFAHYAATFDTVEINNTFYRLPEASVFQNWNAAAPPGFRYAIKFNRYASHRKKLKDPEEPLERFLSRVEELKSYLGPILVQLPPRWGVAPARLDQFLSLAPRRHRWAVEFRDPSWLIDEVYDVLCRHNAALCIHDLIPDHPHVITADWFYQRFHGGRGYARNYEDDVLARVAADLRKQLRAGRDLWVYFNNDVHGHAIRNALSLRGLVCEA